MRVLITAPYNELGRQKIKDTFGEVIYKPWKELGRAYSAEELMALLQESKADALITEHDEVNAEVIDQFPHLRFIGVCRGTPSNVAVDLAKEKGIAVFHTPARNAQAVAELFVSNVIAFLRNTLPAVKWLEDGKWNEGAHASYLAFKGNELMGKTIGMVGFGAVGQAIAKLTDAFSCPILYHDPFYKSENENYKIVELSTVFSEADIVSINLPVTKDTKGLIDKHLLSQMKSDALLVNLSRAIVIKREALLAILEKEKIRGAVLDVFHHEPPDELDNKLIHLPNVLGTPHIAGATFEVEDHHVTILNEQLIAWAKSEQNKNPAKL